MLNPFQLICVASYSYCEAQSEILTFTHVRHSSIFKIIHEMAKPQGSMINKLILN